MKNFITIILTVSTVIQMNGQDFRWVPLQPFESQVQEMDFKLHNNQPPVRPTLVRKLNVDPYIFNKHIQGTGEKFAMVGVYVNLYQNRVKLNLNNISDYMLNSSPWALVSLNFKI